MWGVCVSEKSAAKGMGTLGCEEGWPHTRYRINTLCSRAKGLHEPVACNATTSGPLLLAAKTPDRRHLGAVTSG